MSVLSYNGLTLQVCRFLRGTERTPIFDGPQYLYTRWRLRCRCLYNPQATSYTFPFPADVPGAPGPVQTANLPAQTDQAIRHRLMVPRKQLILGVGNVAWLVSPQQGFTVDSANGPTPISCNIIKGPGGRSFVVDYDIETNLRECNLEVSKYPSIFLSHRWEMEHHLDEDFFTTRIIRGHVIFDTARLYQATNNDGSAIMPDQYRGAFFHPIPTNCQRRIPIVKQHADGNSVEYVIQDEEQQINLGAMAVLEGVTRVEANHHANYTQPGKAKLGFMAAMAVAQAARGAVKGFFEGAAGVAAAAGIAELIPGVGAVGGVPGAAIGAAGSLASFMMSNLNDLLPMQNHLVLVRVHGDGFTRKSNLLSVAQAIADDRMSRLLIGLLGGAGGTVTAWSWDSSIDYDLKKNAVIVSRAVSHTPVVLQSALIAAQALQGIVPTTFTYPFFPSDDESGTTGPGSNDLLAYRDGTTNQPPPGDLISRGTFLENLVAQTLVDPCQNQPVPIGPPVMNLTSVSHGQSPYNNEFPRSQPV